MDIAPDTELLVEETAVTVRVELEEMPAGAVRTPEEVMEPADVFHATSEVTVPSRSAVN
jgi:hypothetical protein